MNAKDVIKDTESKMKKTLEATQREFSVVRTGRASTALVENLRVEYYGAPTPLKQVASVTTPDGITTSMTWSPGGLRTSVNRHACFRHTPVKKQEIRKDSFSHLLWRPYVPGYSRFQLQYPERCLYDINSGFDSERLYQYLVR